LNILGSNLEDFFEVRTDIRQLSLEHNHDLGGISVAQVGP
jgi:hypothetical protein